jgi:hypothetical protein
MAHPQEARITLRAEYLKGLPIELAAEKAGISPSTARRWKDRAAQAGDDWDKFQRAALLVAGGSMDQVMARVGMALVMRSEAILEQLATTPTTDIETQARLIGLLTDCLNKSQSAMKRLMPETSRLSVAMDVLKRLDAYIRENDPQHAEAFAELLPRFGKELAAAYG